MKILFVWDADYPWDIRVEKVCNSLIEEGHEIHLVCRNQKRQIMSEKYKGINLHRIKCLPKCFGALNSAITFPFFFSPLWLWEIYRQAKINDCDLIIVRDLPMALTAVFVGKLLKIPAILDMAECYPEMLRCTWKFERLKISNILLRNPMFADLLENVVLKNIDDVFVMIEESRDRLLGKRVNPKKIHIVSNTPEINRYEILPNTNNEKTKGLKLVYVGLLNPSRGIDTVLMAIKEYVKNSHNIEFIIAGTGKDEKRLKLIVREFKLEKYVTFLGWIDNSKVPELIFGGDICIVPHHKCSHWQSTIPNKLFDYMAAGKPVLATNITPMERIIGQNNCGIIYEDYNAEDLAAKLKILTNEELRIFIGENGKNAIASKYRWDNDALILSEVINKYTREDNIGMCQV